MIDDSGTLPVPIRSLPTMSLRSLADNTPAPDHSHCDKTGDEEHARSGLGHSGDFDAIKVRYPSAMLVVAGEDGPGHAVQRKIRASVGVRKQIGRIAAQARVEFGERQNNFIAIGSGGDDVLAGDVACSD
jgi:hypothetical protein